MAYKVHLNQTVGGKTACNSRYVGNGKFRFNDRRAMGSIPSSHIVKADDFRATPAADRCAHCSDKFAEVSARRRKAAGKSPYLNVWTKDVG